MTLARRGFDVGLIPGLVLNLHIVTDTTILRAEVHGFKQVKH